MRIADLIVKKRDGYELTDEEVRFFIDELVKGRVEGSQIGKSYALLHLKPLGSLFYCPNVQLIRSVLNNCYAEPANPDR